MKMTGYSDKAGLGSVKRAQMEEEAKEILGEIVFHFISKPGVLEGSLPVMEVIMDRWAGDSFLKKMMLNPMLLPQSITNGVLELVSKA